VLITNEPARIDCGAPDYILTRKEIPVGYIEAKDIGVDLGSKSLKEQFDRYRASLNNLVFTDYLDFHFYKDGNFVTKIAIAEFQGGKIVPLPENFDTFNTLFKNFAATISQTIKSPTKLAEMMAGRAKLMADVIEKALNADDEHKSNTALKGQMQTFKTVLIHDISNRAFADLYAQTIAYGMFAARYHDPTLPTFSRQEAATLIPKTNPFLRRLFQDIAGYDLDDRLVWIVDELVQIFLASDVADIMRNFGTRTKQEDPVIHFYETFLAAYDPALRKARGVWYTPEPVVNFIVRAVDDILKTEFGLLQGLADTSKTKIKTKVVSKDSAKKGSKTNILDYEREVHKVQILDPATGTGTFLAEVIKQIHQKFEGQKGIWSKYVENDLIPRLCGFEILMASYAMAHLKLDLLLTETGFKPTTDQRFKVYLTNSLEESHPETWTLFSNSLAEEANEANQVKKETPVMVVLGNPPYSIISSNLAPQQRALVEKYKFIDGIKIKEKGALQFEKIINDDYIKFISLGERFINQNDEGILAYINNHNFIDSPELRGLRWNLCKSFDKIYIIDLHGNSKKKEVSPDGTLDTNVFLIQQGVSINIFVKTGKKKINELAEVFYAESWGDRNTKFAFLKASNLGNIPFKKVNIQPPNFLFKFRDTELTNEYNSFFSIKDLFLKDSTGIISARDNMVIDSEKSKIVERVTTFGNSDLDNLTLCNKLNISLKKGWDIDKARFRVKSLQNLSEHINLIQYRPFDIRYIFYDDSLVWTTARPIMSNFFSGDNVGLLAGKKGQVVGSMMWNLVFISKRMADFNLFYRGGINFFPLYLNLKTSTDSKQTELDYSLIRTPNLSRTIVQQIAQKIGLQFTNEKEQDPATFAPIDLLDYIYAVLHSPTYRETYKEFLKIDFPRVPYPKDSATFWALVALGGQLRQTHLLESPAVEKHLSQYPVDGDNIVRKVKYENGNVYINETQYFANVPPVAWEFYIGGYQPAQKWLKDRKDRELGFEDILHYQKIIVALVETDRLMGEVDRLMGEVDKVGII
jgi:predicted helicase